MRALNPGGDQRLLPYKCNQWRSPDVSLLRVIGLTFCKKTNKFLDNLPERPFLHCLV